MATNKSRNAGSRVVVLLARTQKFSEKGNAPSTFKEKESFGCFLWRVNFTV
jgi:hypothetical protein